MNILILNWRDPKNPKAGGAEVVTLQHAKAWVKKGHTVTWFTSRFNDSSRKDSIDGIEIIRYGNSIGVYLLAPIFYFLNRRRFDFVIDEVHGLPFYTPIYVRKPKIAFIHEVAGEIWDYMYPFPLNIVGRIQEEIYFHFYRNIKIWTDARSTIKDFEGKGIKRENCTAISCPASMKPLERPARKGSKPTFVYAGRVVKMKGVEDVLLAFSQIKKDLKEAQLWIVGGGDKIYLAQLSGLASNLSIGKSIKFFGRVTEKEKYRLLGLAHLQLLTIKVHAGWCIVVIEAASRGTPSVVYRTSGLMDSVKDQETGVILKENKVDELVNEALSLFKDKSRYQLYQQNGLKWAESLTWPRVTKQSTDLIEQVYSEKLSGKQI